VSEILPPGPDGDRPEDDVPHYDVPHDKVPFDKVPHDKVPFDDVPVDDRPYDKVPFDDRPEDKVPFGTRGPEPAVGQPATSPLTAVMLARYLVGRVIAARVSGSLMIIALALLAAAVVVWIWVSHGLAIFVAIIVLIVLGFRALLMAVLRRLMAVGQLGAAEDKVRAMVADTGGDLRRELRRIGLPGSTLGVPLLVIRLIGRRRRETMAKLSQFDVANVVPRQRLNELQFVVRNDILGRPGPPPPG
jgi:hypothetical protein